MSKKAGFEITVRCPRCNENVLENDGKEERVKIVPKGYKGQIEFFITCQICNCRVNVSEKYVPKKTRKSLIKSCVF